MDDISEKLSQILSNKESMDMVKEMAENLLGSNQTSQPSITDGIDMAKVMGIIGKLKASSNSSREKLLLALKPHLKEERQQRLDTAVKILKLLEIAPLLKDSGIF